MNIDFDYLYKKFVVFFYKQNVTCNLKAYHNNYERNDWVIKARYMLLEIDDEIIDNLFEMSKVENCRYLYSDFVAIWVSALLKKEKYLFQIISHLHYKYNGNIFYDAIVFVSLLLFDELPTLVVGYYEYFLEKHQNNPNMEVCVSMVFYCLQYIDIKYDTNYAENYPNIIELTKNHKKIINTILRFSEALRGNIDFKNNDDETFKKELKILLSINATPKEYAFGFLKDKNITSFVHNSSNQNTEKYIFYYAVQQFLNDKILNKISNNETFVKEKLLQTNYLFDILAGIEEDYYYQLPTEIIIIAFEKMLPECAYMYEQYAIHLLLRRNFYDKEAEFYYQKSITLKENYYSVFDKYIHTEYIIKK